MSINPAPTHTLGRTLWYMTTGEPKERVSLRQTALLNRTEPMVILGEAGMGKSHLLGWLGTQHGYALCTARQLINSHAFRRRFADTNVLVIDALDEVSAQKDGEAVDLVLRKLGELNYPRFVLSCRAADWRSATGCETIREQYEQSPTEFHLEPLTRDDTSAFLDAHLVPGASERVIEHFEQRGLAGLLENPQTLELIAQVALVGDLPRTRHGLFKRAVELMLGEQNEQHRESRAGQQPTEASGLDAVGAAFAALILTGREALTRVPNADGIPIQDIAVLPGGSDIHAMLDTRLFRAESANRLSYWHRSIGEFLGARWLARHADTPRKRKRLLSLLCSHGLVPASLRGIHAWLAHDPNFAQAVIEVDPLGLIEYGDADNLSLSQARHLLTALKCEAERNPNHFSWHTAAAKGLFRVELTDDIRAVITSPATAFWLRLYLVKSAHGTAAVSALRNALRHMLTDSVVPLGLRITLVDTISSEFGDDEWREIADTLQHSSDADTLRLALHVLDVAGYHLADDAAIASLVIATVIADERVVGILFPLEQNLPLDRLDGVLDELATKVNTLGKPHERRGDHALTSFVYALLARRLDAGTVVTQRLWTWLKPFEASAGYHDDKRKRVDAHLRADDALRRAIQCLVILDQGEGGDIWSRAWRLERRLPSLNPSPADVVSLLHTLYSHHPDDLRWRELLTLWRTDMSVRAAVQPFVANNPEHLAWIEALTNSPEPEWIREQSERRRVQKENESVKREAQRADYLAHIDEVRVGKFGAILGPAEAYLKFYRDVGSDLPAHQRIAQWLGEDIAEAAHAGFEVFLQAKPPYPTATDIVQAICEGKFLRAACITVAALAERCRTDTGLADLSDEHVLAGFCALRNGMLTRQAGLDALETIVEDEVRRRGLLEHAMRQYYEPQLQAGKEYCSGLETLMRDDTDADLATTLALDWLDAFEELSPSVRQELIFHVVHSPKAASLRAYLDRHVETHDATHRHLLDAAGLLLDFSHTTERLAQTTITSELLWQICNLTTHGEARHRQPFALDAAMMEWIFATFRGLWPMTYHPSGGWSGSQNPWDASEYLVTLLRRLGADHGVQARAALQRLLSAPLDGYSATISTLAAEQARLRAEANYAPPPLDAIEAVLRDTAPITAADLQVLVIEELQIVQAKIRSDDAESWRGFHHDDGTPHAEERCRDHLLGLLRQGCKDIRLDPESHVAGDKEVDITCSCGTLRLPVEIKGQWHRQLWHAADTQLDRLYASDWQAERRGVYLVLWFGETATANKRLVSSGVGNKSPTTPDALKEALIARSQAAQDGRIEVFVLDVTH